MTYVWEQDVLILKDVVLKGSLEFLRSAGELLRQKLHQKHRRDLLAELSAEGEVFSPLLRDALEALLQSSTRPYSDAELCHCRLVPTQKVVEAIHYGADTVQDIARMTSAGTGCGTCQVQSAKLIRHYRGRSLKVG